MTPALGSVAQNQAEALTAIATYSDTSSSNVTHSVAWISRDNNIVTVTSEGVLTAVREGTTAITAIKDGIISNEADVHVC
ncbi:Ig-like domain-containing protein [Vibrio mediterranei]|nr:Ig-like domain-containing protein [Vibrio mediterranei]